MVYFIVNLYFLLGIELGGTKTDLEVALNSLLDEIYENFHDQVGHPRMNRTLHSSAKI